MKKIILILSIILLLILLGLGVFYFLGNGKDKFSNFFSDNSFGSFFDVEPQSKNDFVDTVSPPIETNTTNEEYIAPTLRQISFEPISGYTFYSTTSTSTEITTNTDGSESRKEIKATTTIIRFQERATGHIYDVLESIKAPQKVSNETIQKVYNTIFSSNKNLFVFQTPTFDSEQIRSVFAKINFSTTTGVTLEKSDISSSISDFVYNKDSNKLIYSVKQNGVSNIFTSNIDRTDEKLIATLPFNDFLLDPVNASEILVTTKASYSAIGYSYLLNTTSGSITKILGGIPGLLVKVSPDKKYYLYSQSDQTKPSIRSYNATNGAVNLITIDTIPEKCVFSQKNNVEIYCFGSVSYKAAKYPDDWYMGKIFNSDSLYKINLADNFIEIIYNFESEDLSFDGINPQIIGKDNFILFENKYDLTLWSIDLSKLSNELR